jgi:hypothetical protein
MTDKITTEQRWHQQSEAAKAELKNSPTAKSATLW